MSDKKGLFPNTTAVFNIIFDFFMTFLSGSEFKVLMFFVRQTYGFQRYNHVGYAITQISEGLERYGNKVSFGTGLSRDGVRRAIESLIGYGILRCNRGNFLNSESNTYSLAFHEPDFNLREVCNNICSVRKISMEPYENFLRDSCEKEVPYRTKISHIMKQSETKKEISSDTSVSSEKENIIDNEDKGLNNDSIQETKDQKISSVRADTPIIALYRKLWCEKTKCEKANISGKVAITLNKYAKENSDWETMITRYFNSDKYYKENRYPVSLFLYSETQNKLRAYKPKHKDPSDMTQAEYNAYKAKYVTYGGKK